MKSKQQERKLKIQEIMDASGVRFGTSGARGLVSGMTDEVCYAFTAAFLQSLPETARTIALAMDLRPSSPRIAAACAAAIRDAGLGVEYCGYIPTPALACHAQTLGLPGIMVTGSHIPFDRNGIKFYGVHGEISKEDEACIGRAEVGLPQPLVVTPLSGESPDARREYIDRYLAFFPPRILAGMKLGVYEHSSVARDLLREILEPLGAEMISLGRTDDFVPIDTEAVSQADMRQAQAWARQHGFDAIISTDGDADRPLLGDERGNWLRGDIVGILCASYLGANSVVTTVSCNTAADQCGKFQKVLRTRIGSPYVIEAIESLIAAGERGVVGFEPNGGFMVGTTIERKGKVLQPLMTRDAVLPILCLLSMAREQGCNISGLPTQLPGRFTASDRLQAFPTEKSRKILQNLHAQILSQEDILGGLCGKPISLDQTDGIRIFFENGEIVHFRPSGNAPELRCYAEANDPGRAGVLVEKSLNYLKDAIA